MLFAQVDVIQLGTAYAPSKLQAIPYLHGPFPVNDNRAGGSSKEREMDRYITQRDTKTRVYTLFI